jgi:hypothetical protein
MITSAWEHIPGGTESGLSVFSTALFYRSAQLLFRHVSCEVLDLVNQDDGNLCPIPLRQDAVTVDIQFARFDVEF